MNYSRLLFPLVFAALTSTAALASTYTVKSGDTLSAIARATGTDAGTLMRLNGLNSSTIQVGQKLNIGGATVNAPVRNAAPAASTTGGAYVRTAAARFLGVRYALGGNGRNGLDCSSFTQSVFRNLGINLPRTAAGQWNTGRAVSRRDLRAGDLVFFNTMGRVASHVGLYVGDGMMANANSYKGRTVIEPLFANAYWANRYNGARRVMN
ncbi:peptidase [Deinococcus radiopugnans]|uniref:Peptidase n=2 Tax=Deinococcus radiopugnans TaxID=57497 RepID=A0A0A7KF05_9DEIO|nr:LysM peptidoglycan-binding domain-containing C40 family peptidase [Deinococcus radiopugnans]AIZ44747.1 peptidase [Deinococcus radiopugnans]MBB6016452.1 cell wall-associated NlpC family hydrolase [Deinococcus radiopugnans ATCC 19172]QLG10371.1 peptidoglycan endopeptidase [Deinococcus sp. D7000]TNM71203.1 peptidoglycan endopeptidase [Deinococcus radiopugnans ATCC 19172]